ncbi:hypothetical protein [Streptomyces xanthophaeus]
MRGQAPVGGAARSDRRLASVNLAPEPRNVFNRGIQAQPVEAEQVPEDAALFDSAVGADSCDLRGLGTFCRSAAKHGLTLRMLLKEIRA